MGVLSGLRDKIQGKPVGSGRSTRWPGVRKKHLEVNPVCAACGGSRKLEVHHIKPFHLFPDLELEPTNLITLCEGNKAINCHLLVGHLFSYKSWNPAAREDAAWVLERKNRS